MPRDTADKKAWLIEHGIKAKRYDLVVTAVLQAKEDRNTEQDIIAIWKHITNEAPLYAPADQSGYPNGRFQNDVHTWLPDLGLRGLWNKVQSKLDLNALEAFSGVPIFLSGPHQGGRLNVTAGGSFGHYNPAFINWFRANIIPMLTAPSMSSMVRSGYNRSLKNLGRAYAAAYRYLATERDIAGLTARFYHQEVTNASPSSSGLGMKLQEKFRSFSDRQARDGLDWYETNVAAGFWVRRHIDGTHVSIHQGLMELLKVYDPEIYKEYHQDLGPEISDSCMNTCMSKCSTTCASDPKNDNCVGNCQETCLNECELPAGVPTLIPQESHEQPVLCTPTEIQGSLFPERSIANEEGTGVSPSTKTTLRMCDSTDTEAIRKHPDMIPAFDGAITRFVRCSVISFANQAGHNLLLEFGEDTFNTHTVLGVTVNPNTPPKLVFSTGQADGVSAWAVRKICDVNGDGQAEVLAELRRWDVPPESRVFSFIPMPNNQESP